MNLKKTSIAFMAALAATTTFAHGEAPEGYYDSAYNLAGTALLEELHNIIDGHHDVGYAGLWKVYYTSDVRPDGTIWDMYSTKHWNCGTEQCGNYKNIGDCYNREHSMPKSWFDDKAPMVSDAFHIYPTDGKVNNQRLNYPFGECANGTNLGTYKGVTALGKLGYSTFPGYTDIVFEPDDEYKGDFARTYFYMATRYYDQIKSWKSPMLAGNSYPAFTSWAVELLLKWNEQDPVSEKEVKRNDAVYIYQGNRNPYIDHPELAMLIWGDLYGDEWMEGAYPNPNPNPDPDPDPNPDPDPDPKPDPNPGYDADTYSHTFSSGDITTEGGEISLSDVDWQTTPLKFAGWSDRGAQLGSANNAASTWTISTDAFSGREITSVTVSGCCAGKGSATVTATVGDSAYGSACEIDDSGITDCQFTGTATAGKLSITFTNHASKAMYIQSIKVTSRKPQSGINHTSVASATVTPCDGGVTITTGNDWIPVSIYSADGIKWFSGEVAETEYFELEPGFYIVRAGGKPHRILVK